MPNDANRVSVPHGHGLEQWQVNRYVVVFAALLYFLGMTFVLPFLPLYVHQLGVTDIAQAALWSGVLLAASPLVSGFMSPIWAHLADRVGLKLMFERTVLAFGLVFFGMSLVTDVYQLLALRILWGFFGGFNAIATIMVSVDGPRDQMSRGLGLLQSAQFISYALGPIVGGSLADAFGLRQSFYAPTVLCAIVLAATHFLYREPTRAEGTGKRREKEAHLLRSLVAMPQFLPLVAVLFLAQFIDKSFSVTIPLFVASVEGTTTGIAALAGGIISSGAVAAAISASLIGRAATKRSPQRLLMFTLICGAIVSVPMALASTPWQLLILRTLLGLLAGGTITLVYTVGGLALPSSGRAAALGFLTSAAVFGAAASSIVSGALIAINIHASFVVNSISYALALGALIIAARRIARRSRVDPPELVPSSK